MCTLAIGRPTAHDRGMRRPLLALAALTFALGLAESASAQVYKYTKPDGTVVYTDKLSDLPADRRAHYNKLEKEAQERRKAQVNMLGEAEVKRREVEAERKRVEQAQLEEQERARRLAEIDATLEQIRKRQAKTAGNKKAWQDRMKKAKAELKAALKEFRETQEAYNGLATKADYTLLPGQGKQKEELRKKVAALEKRVDAAIREVYVVIPEEARKAGVPPGWLR